MRKFHVGLMALVAVVAIVDVGCGDSDPPNGSVFCGTGPQKCPQNYYCSGGTCWRNNTGPDAGSKGDGAVDVNRALDGSSKGALDVGDTRLDGSAKDSATRPDVPLDAPGVDVSIAIDSVGTDGEAGVPADRTHPRVLDVDPKDGKVGLFADARVTITFSEPMNAASVEDALTVSGMLPADLSLSWNSDGSVLTLAAKAGFAYAVGTTTAVVPNTYTVSLSAAALDLAGNALSPTFTTSFTTMRRLTTTVTAKSPSSYSTYASSTGALPSSCTAGSLFRLGSWTNASSAGTYYIFVVLDTSTISKSAVVGAASLVASQGAEVGSFYASGGQVLLEKMAAYQEIDKTVLSAASDTMGTLATTASVLTPSLSILTPFYADVRAGTQLQLYRLTGSGGASNSFAQFVCSGFSFRATYLIP